MSQSNLEWLPHRHHPHRPPHAGMKKKSMSSEYLCSNANFILGKLLNYHSSINIDDIHSRNFPNGSAGNEPNPVQEMHEV